MMPSPVAPLHPERNALQDQLAAVRLERSVALRRLKAGAQAAAKDLTDSGTHAKPSPTTALPQINGISGIHCPAERLEVRKEQVEEAREQRKKGVARFKTTVQAITTYRETTLLKGEELQKRLNEERNEN